MPWWFWPLYYPLSIAAGAGLGYAYGRAFHGRVGRLHARLGTRPPYPFGPETARAWRRGGAVVGAVVPAASGVVTALLRQPG
jgi:hypothetical protein